MNVKSRNNDRMPSQGSNAISSVPMIFESPNEERRRLQLPIAAFGLMPKPYFAA
jgi:hypothetical protein